MFLKQLWLCLLCLPDMINDLRDRIQDFLIVPPCSDLFRLQNIQRHEAQNLCAEKAFDGKMQPKAEIASGHILPSRKKLRMLHCRLLGECPGPVSPVPGGMCAP